MYMFQIEGLISRVKNFDFKGRLPQVVGGLLLLISLTILTLTYFDYIVANINYLLNSNKVKDVVVKIKDDKEQNDSNNNEEIVFLDKEFGVYIPKIDANATVIPNVDPFNEFAYTSALEKGVAHARNTALPNEKGNAFLFAHSAVNFYEQRKYNVYFYLLTKLNKDDDIYVSYKSKIYTYKVREVKIVNPTDIQYMQNIGDTDTVTLMTCYPPGLNIKRVVVVGEKVESN